MRDDEFRLNVSETVPDRSSASVQERTCDECGKPFHIPRLDIWAYRLVVKPHTLWFCRWNCLRAGERKLENAKAGRKKELKSKKPSKNELETDLRAGLSIANIAKIYDASVQSAHNWIKSYGLAGIQGIKKPKVEEHTVEEERIPVIEDMVQESPTLAEIEQFHTDTEATINQLPDLEKAHIEEQWDAFRKANYSEPPGMTEEENMSDEEYDRIMATVEVQAILTELPDEPPDPIAFTIEAELDPVPELETRETCEEIWNDVSNDIKMLRRLYVAEAEKSFNERLRGLFLEVTG